MMVSEEEAKRRLESSSNLINSLSIPLESSPVVTVESLPNNRHRSVEVPEFLRVIAGTLAHTESAREVGGALGISPYTVHGYKHGKLGTDDGRGQKVDEGLRDKVDIAVNGAQKVAVQKLMDALGLITVEKMSKSTAKDLSTIASNMARVVEKTTTRQDDANRAQIIIYAPQVKTESKYTTIEV